MVQDLVHQRYDICLQCVQMIHMLSSVKTFVFACRQRRCSLVSRRAGVRVVWLGRSMMFVFDRAQRCFDCKLADVLLNMFWLFDNTKKT